MCFSRFLDKITAIEKRPYVAKRASRVGLCQRVGVSVERGVGDVVLVRDEREKECCKKERVAAGHSVNLCVRVLLMGHDKSRSKVWVVN